MLLNFNSIFGSKSYIVYDSKTGPESPFGKLTEKKLNFLQCFLRKIFGCYSETHLKNCTRALTQDTVRLTKLYSQNEKNQKLIDKIEQVVEKHMPTNACLKTAFTIASATPAPIQK